MAARHTAFEWDHDKAGANLAKHGVSFEAASAMLADPWGDQFQMDRLDDRHEEERWTTIGSTSMDRNVLLVVVWTPRGEVTRIISARRAESHERRDYERKRGKNRPL